LPLTVTTGELVSFVELAAPGMAVAPALSFGSRNTSRWARGSSVICRLVMTSAARASV
jgi:hypothetical protein